VNKSDLVEAVAAKASVAKADVARVVDALFGAGGVMTAELKRGGIVRVSGFGRFETRSRAARKGRNPRTGREIAIAASTTAVFHAGKALKEALNRRR
jgi:DNA-binding protein HU-beta